MLLVEQVATAACAGSPRVGRSGSLLRGHNMRLVRSHVGQEIADECAGHDDGLSLVGNNGGEILRGRVDAHLSQLPATGDTYEGSLLQLRAAAAFAQAQVDDLVVLRYVG